MVKDIFIRVSFVFKVNEQDLKETNKIKEVGEEGDQGDHVLSHYGVLRCLIVPLFTKPTVMCLRSTFGLLYCQFTQVLILCTQIFHESLFHGGT